MAGRSRSFSRYTVSSPNAAAADPARLRERRRKLFRALDARHSLASASGRGLDQERETEAACLRLQSLVRPGRRDRSPARPALRPRASSRAPAACRPSSSIAAARRAHPGESRRLHRAGERGALREKAVAGVNRVGLRLARRFEKARDREVGVRGGPLPRPTRGRHLPHVKGFGVGVRDRRRPPAMPISRAVRPTRTAISPRLATGGGGSARAPSPAFRSPSPPTGRTSSSGRRARSFARTRATSARDCLGPSRAGALAIPATADRGDRRVPARLAQVHLVERVGLRVVVGQVPLVSWSATKLGTPSSRKSKLSVPSIASSFGPAAPHTGHGRERLREGGWRSGRPLVK